ncbi:hypothetical protein [Vibrio fluvialis]|uniref:hypothetical protein n=1 Tax=Vibrio fluvialis TaxID=676 RepID=UPI0011229640|nr:hypothetical protein [Vibrio fluvialis]TOY95090.1 hypothetical protein DJ016_01965 [Vibrio fluvialis]TRN14659.1 hypothetical protein DM587_01775 [Vibrio fluvialis]
MPSTENHPSFPLTIDRDQKIWRYMDFTKFMHLLTTKSLWFNRSDKFEDPFEGKYPLKNLQQMRGQEWAVMEHLIDHMRQFTYINCWYISNHESAAMWKLYAQTSEAIAIQTTYEKLHSLMPEECFIGELTYIDYKNDVIQINNAFNPHMIKRNAFSHERELRALIQDNKTPSKENPDRSGKMHDYSAVNDKFGLSVSVNPLDLIHNVFVAPMSPTWFKELVREICINHGIEEKSIIISELDDEPY